MKTIPWLNDFMDQLAERTTMRNDNQIAVRTPKAPEGLLDAIMRQAKCAKYSTITTVLYLICYDVDKWLGVAGDPDNGCYEQFTFDGKTKQLDMTDVAYGDSVLALYKLMRTLDEMMEGRKDHQNNVHNSVTRRQEL